MLRKEAVEFLMGQLRKLKEKNLIDLMKAKRINELWKLAKELEILSLQKYCIKEHLCLKTFEIPKEYYYELAFYLTQSEIFDHEIFLNPWEFRETLRETKDELAIQIADIMTKYNLCDCTIRELICGKKRR